MAIKLHRCSNVWLKIGGHPCWRVQKALDEQGIPYELVKGPLRRGQRDDLQRLSGQRQYPVIEFEDGTIYREQSADMAATIRAGRLETKHPAPAPPAQTSAAEPITPPHEDLPTQPEAEPPLEPPRPEPPRPTA
jgi:glutaredoxin